MAILGKIRQQSIFLIIVIGLALFAFIISGVFGNGSGDSGPNDPLGIVNGEEIQLENFRVLVEQEERVNGSSTIQAVNLVWDQYIQSLVLKSQFSLLGIDAGKNQIEQAISNTESFVKDERFLNEAGFFDFGLFSNFIIQMRDQNPAAYEQWKTQEANIIGSAKQSIYFDLIRSSLSLPDNEIKNNYHLENDNIDLRYVKIPFSSISDSLSLVSESEIDNYITSNKNKYEFRPIRDIDYVAFLEQPTDEDEEIIRTELEDLLENRVEYNEVSKLTDTIIGFKRTNSLADFVDKHSEVEFDSIYLPKGRLASEYGEMLYNLNINNVFGPYKEIGSIKISRLLDRKKNGSIRASQILISFKGASQSNLQVDRNKKQAKILANKIYNQLRRNPSRFFELVTEYSDDVNGKSTGGDLGFFQELTMNEKIFNFSNRSKIKSIGIVETEFGFHVIKVVAKQDLLLFANIVKKIVPSDKTSNEVFKNATQFEMNLAKDNDISKLAGLRNYNIKKVKNIDILDENIPGLPDQRSIVKWAFEGETEVGMIKRFNLSFGGYAIVKLIKAEENGLISSNEVRKQVYELLVKNKKASLIIKTNDQKSSLEDFAAKNSTEIREASAITQVNEILVGAGKEPYVIGSAFSLNEGEISSVIIGDDGVYKVELIKKRISEEIEDYSNLIKVKLDKEESFLGPSVLNALKNSSDIIDNRSLYY